MRRDWMESSVRPAQAACRSAETAAQDYFHTSAAHLTRNQAARLAAILPDPTKWNAAEPGPYVSGRARVLLGQADVVSRDGLDSCVK